MVFIALLGCIAWWSRKVDAPVPGVAVRDPASPQITNLAELSKGVSLRFHQQIEAERARAPAGGGKMAQKVVPRSDMVQIQSVQEDHLVIEPVGPEE